MRGAEEVCPACSKPVLTAVNDPSNQACSDPECVHAHGLPKYRVGLDLAFNAPPAVTVVEVLKDNHFRMVDPVYEPMEFSTAIEKVVRARLREQHTRHEEFLRTVLRVTDPEYMALQQNLMAAALGDPMAGGRGYGKTLRTEVAERIMKRMNEEPLPENFWDTVAAYNMLTDPEGRRLVKAIIDRKAGCSVERSSD